MKALVCQAYGPIDNLEVKTIPTPAPAADEVVIDVAYASVNYPDTLIVQGLYQVKPPVPFIPGHECSGRVSAVGAAVTNFKIGDRVYVSTGVGSFSEQVCVKANRVKPMPDTMSMQDGALLSVTYITSLHALKDQGQLKAGETVLVLGASGGVGSAAIELAKAMGAQVIAAASTNEKLEYCKTLGADHVINYDTEDLRERVKDITGGKGVDVVYDPVGDRYTEPAFRSLGYHGRHLVVGFAAGEIPNIPLNLALLSERSIIGVYVGAWAPRAGKEIVTLTQLLNMWLKTGKIKPKVTKIYTLDQAKEALHYAASRNLVGKALIEVDSKIV